MGDCFMKKALMRVVCDEQILEEMAKAFARNDPAVRSVYELTVVLKRAIKEGMYQLRRDIERAVLSDKDGDMMEVPFFYFQNSDMN